MVTKYLHGTENPSCKANSPTASQEIPRLLLNVKVHYRAHKITSLVHILSLINSVHAPFL
jgi:hypothetical protein